MNTAAAYTPLERLLLFQSLVAFGTEEEDFNRISELLTNNSLVKDGPTYNAQRLSSEALRNQYLQLLRDELKAEEQDGQDESSNPNSKKRKIPTPPLPSLKDAREYRDKLPLLVDRLYARYRDYMVREIREEEKRYAAIQREIDEIKRGEWDERLLRESGALGNGNGNTAGVQPVPQVKPNGVPTEPARQGDIARETPKQTTPRISPVPPQVRPDHIPINNLPNNQQQPPLLSPRLTDQIRPPPGFPPPPNHQRTPSAGPHGPQTPQAGPQPGNFIWEPPLTAPNQLSPYQPPPQGYPQYGQYPSPQQYPPPPRGSFSNPNSMSPHPPPPHHTVPSSPGHLPQQQHPGLLPPQPGGVRRSPSSQGMPLDALADVASHQYRAASGSPVFSQHAPQQHGPPQNGPPPHGTPQHGPQPYGPPPPQGYAQPYPLQQRPLSANGHPQWPQQQQYMQPYSPQPPYQAPQAQRPLPFQPPQQVQYSSPYNTSQGLRPPIPLNQTPRFQPNFPSTPVSGGSARNTTGTGTKWTPIPSTGTPGGSIKLAPPEIEKIPDIDLQPKFNSTSSATPSVTKPKRGRPKGSRGAGPSKGAQRTRAGSVTSSIVAGSQRSQSIMSHADELSMENEATDRRVKEEVATPIGVDDAGDTTADESTLPRHKRNIPSPRQSTKRKRDLSHAFETRTPSGPPTQVLWTKNFPKISISALENISATKNASMFAIPVKERDAPGYSQLILRPQDLKSIRSAITAGNRAAQAAAPEDMNPNATSIWLPISEDLVPPKGIINYAQLEKELMRMFANAIMFNPDPDRGFGPKWSAAMASSTGGVLGYAVDEDSVVKATRAMFADVEKTVGDLRVAERKSEETRESSVARGNAEDDEVDELAGDGENHATQTGSVAKRRRKA